VTTDFSERRWNSLRRAGISLLFLRKLEAIDSFPDRSPAVTLILLRDRDYSVWFRSEFARGFRIADILLIPGTTPATINVAKL
jgi:hypothetical protein